MLRRSRVVLLYITVFVLVGENSLAQIKKSVRSTTFKVPTFTSSKQRKICPTSSKGNDPHHGIGFKLGDPFAITYKLYLNKHWGFVGDVGLTPSSLSSPYYKKVFKTYTPDNIQKTTKTISYISHQVPIDWSFQIKFIYQLKIDAIFEGLQVYFGLGWQWRMTELQYSYSYVDTNPLSRENRILEFNTLRFTHGGVGIIGFEYTYASLPLSAFIETEFFIDTFSDVGHSKFQGGIGIRYIF